MLNINAPATIGSAPIHRAARTRRKWPLENSNASPVTRRHDGFTLNDLVSYDRKHNEQNGEDNRDGSDDNRSWNGGGEEPTDDPAIEKLRSRRSAPDTEPQPYRVPPSQLIRHAHVTWHGVKLYEPDWSPSLHRIACTWRFTHRRMLFHAIFNAYWEPLEFELPPVVDSAQVQWRRWIATSLDSPHNIVECEEEAPQSADTHIAPGRARSSCCSRRFVRSSSLMTRVRAGTHC